MLDCCDAMKQNSRLPTAEPVWCDALFDDSDVLITVLATHGPGIIFHDGGSAISVINFCPWCGMSLRGAPATEEGR